MKIEHKEESRDRGSDTGAGRLRLIPKEKRLAVIQFEVGGDGMRVRLGKEGVESSGGRGGGGGE